MTAPCGRCGQRQRLLERALDVPASALRDHLLGVGAGRHADVPDGPRHCLAQSRRYAGRRPASSGRQLEDLAVALEHLDGRPSERVAVRGDAAFLQQVHQFDKNIVDVRAVRDGNVAMVLFSVLDEVDRGIEERLNAFVPVPDRRDDRSSEEPV